MAFGRNDPHHHHDDRHDHGHHDHHGRYTAPMRGRGEVIHFAFKQVSLLNNDKHVHVLLWLDGQSVCHESHGMGEVAVQLQPGRHQVGIAVYNPDAMFDARHPHQPESTADFTLPERRGVLGGLLGLLRGRDRDQHVVIEYSVSQNLLTKAANAKIRRVKILR